MQYCSVLYLGVFLPLTLLFYKMAAKEKRWIILLIASYIFFFSLSGKLLIYLLFSTLSIHHIGLWIGLVNKEKEELLNDATLEEKKEIKKNTKKKIQRILFLSIFIHLGLLIGFKYTSFFGININNLFKMLHISYQITIPKIIMPIGISFYTLQAISYIIDVYNKKIEPDSNLGRLALYMAFFPSIMEGPICRYSDTAFSLYEGHDLTYQNITRGAQRILWGMLKKMVVADRLNTFVKNVSFSYAALDGGSVFIWGILYTIQLYMDFSGTMDMVLGSAEMFGIKLPENFRQPFFSKNISEFWSRWHITLGTWFRDYIFYPISLSHPLKKLSLWLRKHFNYHIGSLVVGSVALLIVWLCNGLWHGAAWNFIFFGLYHFGLIVLANILQPLIIKICHKLKINRNSKLYKFGQMLKTSLLVVIGEMIFRANGFREALKMLKLMVTNFSFKAVQTGNIFHYGLDRHDLAIVVLVVILVLVVSVMKEKNIDIRSLIAKQSVLVRWLIYYGLILMVIIFGAYGSGYAPVDPLYANF